MCPSPLLNDRQRAAVHERSGHLLIVAGPGTGKTHTLTHRIAFLARDLEPGKQILAVSFTNKAAGEMRSRLASHMEDMDGRVQVGTFHSFCWSVLQEFPAQAGLPEDIQILPAEDVPSTVKAVWPDASQKERRQKMERIGRLKSQAVTGPAGDPDLLAYNAFLREQKFLDFDDVLIETVRLLQAGPGVLDTLHNRFRDICVDEYQDINPVQHQLLKLLVSPATAVTAIGDPHQAIYGFRGSDVGFFSSFRRDFPGTRVLELSDNYRSARNILSASGQVIGKAQGLHVPELTARIYEQGRLVIHESPTDRAEAEFVVHSIERLIGGTSMFSQDSGRVHSHEDGGYSFGDIAVLYRLNAQHRLLREAFDRSGIPYHVSGAVVKEEGREEGEAGAWEDFVATRYPEPSMDVQKVSCMTLHAAKGLEFPVVFIIGCEDHLLPLDLEGLTSDSQEERRLFYVGMTRARERLVLVRSAKRRLYGRTRQYAPSPFLKDIEDRLKEYEELRHRKKKKTEKQITMFG